MGSGWRLAQPKLIAERIAAARDFRKALGGASPYYVDSMEDEACRCYVAWPERLFVVGIDGILEYVGGFGLEGYDVTELERFLEARYTMQAGVCSTSVRSFIADVANPVVT